MNQDTTEWLPTSKGDWIGCTEEREVVYKNEELKDAWERADGEDVRKAKYFVWAWAWARAYRASIAEGDPQALGGQAKKDKTLEGAAGQVEFFKTRATQAVNEACAT